MVTFFTMPLLYIIWATHFCHLGVFHRGAPEVGVVSAIFQNIKLN
jgi:hypothetical protein